MNLLTRTLQSYLAVTFLFSFVYFIDTFDAYFAHCRA